MVISGTEKELGATYQAKRIENDEVVYGIGIVNDVDDKNKSYLIQLFETNDFTDGAPAMAYYIAVKTDSIIPLTKFGMLSIDDNYDEKNIEDIRRMIEETKIGYDGKAYGMVQSSCGSGVEVKATEESRKACVKSLLR